MSTSAVMARLTDVSIDQLDTAAWELRLSRSRLVREVVEAWLDDPEALERMRERLAARRKPPRTGGRPGVFATPGAPAATPEGPPTDDPEWVRATLLPMAPDVAGMSHDELRALAKRGDVPFILERAWERQQAQAKAP